jgi:hypothetical protein
MQIKRLAISMLFISSAGLTQLANAEFIPFMPRASVIGLGGSNAAAQGDLLVPLIGDNGQLWYGAAQASYGAGDAWSGGLGTGYRKLTRAGILGAYVFFDGNNTQSKQRFWTISPGVERLGETWDFRLNGFLPVRNKRWQEAFRPANELGIEDYIEFSGHSMRDRLAARTGEAGKGIEAQIAYHVSQLPGLTVAGGAYHYHYQTADNVSGVAGRLEYRLNRQLGLVLNDSYDKEQGNQLGVGIKISFGGNAQDNNHLNSRLTDEIQRGIGVFNQGTLSPMRQGLTLSQNNQLVSDNVWFFKPALGLGNAQADGTYEHPFSGLEQSSVDQAGSHAKLFVAAGDYGWQDSIGLNAGQTLQGRTEDYRLAAQGQERPMLYGSIDVIQKDNVTIDGLQFGLGSDPEASSIAVTGAKSVTINNVLIDKHVTGTQTARGIDVINAQGMVINNSEIRVASNGVNAAAYGLAVLGSDLTINNSQITSQAQGKTVKASAIRSIGVGNNHLAINNSSLNAIAEGTVEAVAYGVEQSYSAFGGDEANFINLDHVKVNVQANGKLATAIGLQADGLIANLGVTIQNSQFSVLANASEWAKANGIELHMQNGTYKVLIKNNTIQTSVKVETSIATSDAIAAIGSNSKGDMQIVNNDLQSGASSELEIAVAQGVALSLDAEVKANISHNTITTHAQSGQADAVGIGIIVADGLGVVAKHSSATEVVIDDNTIRGSANGAQASVSYAAGIYLAGLPAVVTANKISSEANGSNSKAYGIVANSLKDSQLADNEFNLLGNATAKADITDDMLIL